MKFKHILKIAIIISIQLCYSQRPFPTRFTGIILASENEKYIKDWVSTGYQTKINVSRQDTAIIDKQLHITFITTLFGIIDDTMDVSVDVKIIKPNGKYLMEENKYSKIYTRIETSLTFIMFPKDLELKFDDTDEKGEYLIIAKFHDLNYGTRNYIDSLKIKLK